MPTPEDHATLPEAPPLRPSFSANDREGLRSNLLRCLKAHDLSQRALERRVGFGAGYVSKVLAGRIPVKLETMLDIAKALNVGPETLVEGTGYAELLRGSPETPEGEDLQIARQRADNLEVELAASRADHAALVEGLRQELADAISQRDALRKENAQLDEVRLRLVVEAGRQAEALQLAQRNTARLRTSTQELSREVAAQGARSNELRRLLEDWRRHACELDARRVYLEQQLAQLAQRIRQQDAAGVGAAVLAALLGLGIGAVAASPTPKGSPKRARR